MSCTVVDIAGGTPYCDELVGGDAALNASFTGYCTPAGYGSYSATPGAGCAAGWVGRCSYVGPNGSVLIPLPAGAALNIQCYTAADCPGFSDACMIDGGQWTAPGTSTYYITGTVSGSLNGVLLTLAGAASRTTFTSAGQYSIWGIPEGSYTVTPSLANYTFNPASITVVVNGTNATVGKNFVATPTAAGYTISGAVSGAVTSGVTLALSGAASASTTSGGGGAYSFTGLANGTYTVTPSLAGYTFTPSSLSVSVAGASVTGRNFTSAAAATTYAVSGTVSGAVAAGVSVALSGPSSATTTTGTGGTYSFAGLANGNYTLTPSLAGYTFTPSSLSVSVAGGSVTGRNFTSAAAATTYAVSGTVSGAVAAGVTVVLSGTASRTAVTDAGGSYTVAGLVPGAYTVTPILPGYAFSPTGYTVHVSAGNVAGVSFTSSASVALSGAGGGTWSYRRPVVVTRASGAGTLVGYAVAVTADTAALVSAVKLRPDAADLRFTNATGAELPYWIERGFNTTTTRIWVSVDSIPAAGTTLYMIYGNPSAVVGGAFANAPWTVFPLYDAFPQADGVALDPMRWSAGQQYVRPTVVAHAAHFAAACSGCNVDGREAQTSMPFAESRVVEMDVTMTATPNPPWKSTVFIARVGLPGSAYSSPLGVVRAGWWSNGVQDCALVNGTYPVQVVADTVNGTLQMTMNGTVCGTVPLSPAASPYVFEFTVETGTGSISADLRGFRVRSYTSPEPVAQTPGVEAAY